MFEKKYKIGNLFVAELGLITSRKVESYGIIRNEACRTGEFIIVYKYKQHVYNELFTDNSFTTKLYNLNKGEIFIDELYTINEYLTDAELSTGKITKSRLIEIYRMLNKREDEYDDNYENYQDGTNGKVIKFARKCNKK